MKEIAAGIGSNPLQLTKFQDSLFFTANDGASGRGLWKTDGTEAGTSLVKMIGPEYNPTVLESLVIGNTLYFTADDGQNGVELWSSDGTAAGTRMVKDIRPGSGSNPRYFAGVNGMLYFGAVDGVHGEELWKSDGTEAGTVLVKDLTPGPDSCSPQRLVNFGGTLYFLSWSTGQLWKSDGTDAGTVLVTQRSFSELIVAADTLYLSWTDRTLDGLWKSDGTEVGTVLVKDVSPGINENYRVLETNRYFVDVNGILYFISQNDWLGLV